MLLAQSTESQFLAGGSVSLVIARLRTFVGFITKGFMIPTYIIICFVFMPACTPVLSLLIPRLINCAIWLISLDITCFSSRISWSFYRLSLRECIERLFSVVGMWSATSASLFKLSSFVIGARICVVVVGNLSIHIRCSIVSDIVFGPSKDLIWRSNCEWILSTSSMILNKSCRLLSSYL